MGHRIVGKGVDHFSKGRLRIVKTTQVKLDPARGIVRLDVARLDFQGGLEVGQRVPQQIPYLESVSHLDVGVEALWIFANDLLEAFNGVAPAP